MGAAARVVERFPAGGVERLAAFSRGDAQAQTLEVPSGRAARGAVHVESRSMRFSD